MGEGTQQWIFLLFALAFLVKAPLFPLHGWVPETYRSTPIVVLALLSGVLSKVGVYGFLRIVLPTMPDAAQHFQELMLVLAVFSILYGSILAFSQDNMRLVVAYSSIAQLGFIVLGIFSLDDVGAQGAVLQMLNHGLVVIPLFLVIGAIAARAGGSESLSELGGMAKRAPVLAALFLITTFATLAMPGSANFVGEILMLFGTFEDNLVYGLVASIGVVLAAVYMIRLFQRTMHNREGAVVQSRELSRLDLAAIAPLVAVIVALGVYPNFVTSRSEDATIAKLRGVGGDVTDPALRRPRRAEPRDGSAGGRPMTFIAAVTAPEIDYKALSPLMAVLGGSLIVLMVGLLRSRFARETIVPLLTAATLFTAIGLSVWIWEPGDSEPIIEGALAVDPLSLGISVLVYIAGIAAVLLSLRARAVREAGQGEYFALLLGSVAGMVVLAEAESLITLFVGLELLSIPLYVLCAAELKRKTSLEAGLKYLVVGSVGSATLLYGLALIYGATGRDGLPGHPGRHRRGRVGHGPAPAHRHRPHGHRPGLQGVGGPVPPVDAGRLPGRAHAGHRLHGRGHQGSRVRSVPEAVRPRPRARPAPVGPGAGRAGGGDHHGGQRGGDRAALAQADARLVERGPGGLPARRRGGGQRAGRAGHRLLPRRLPGDEPRGLRGRDRARAGVRARRRPGLAREPRVAPSHGWPGR